MYNCDETGINTVGSAVKVLAKKGQKQVGLVASGERGTNTTVMCCFSASGNYIPPMFIFKRQRMTPLLQKGGPQQAIYCCSKSGWITEDLFVTWLQHFQKITKCSMSDPVLLILDNHSSHASLQAYEFCKFNGIHMLSLPPHTSHRIQPLDVVFYGPLKKAINREIDLHMKTRQYERVTQYDLAAIFKAAYGRVASVEKAEKGFQCTGIYPFNPNVFSEEDFVPCEDATNAVQSAPGPGPSGFSPLADSNVSSPGTPVAEISPIPIMKKCQPTARKGTSLVLTASPMKTSLVEKELKRKNKAGANTKKAKNRKLPQRRVFSSSSSETSEDIVLDDDGLADAESSDDEICIVCGDFGKGRETWFRCTGCGKWPHKECSGLNKPDNYICDFCLL